MTYSERWAAIVKSEPDWSALPSDTPFLIRRLLRQCLVKDPRHRLGDIRDARLDIAESLSLPAPDPVQSVSRSARREWLAWAAAAAAVLVAVTILALFAAGVIHVGGARTDPQVTRFDIQQPSGVIGTGAPTISPDGRRIVFPARTLGGSRVIWVRSLDSPISQPLSGTEGGSYPFWSPDSRFLGFFAGGLLKRIDIGGGPAVALCEAPVAGGGSWSPSGVIVFGSALGLKRVSAAGGTPDQLTTVEQGQEVAHIWPHFLPDGRRFVYLSVRTGGVQNAIHLAALDAPTGRPIVATDAQAMYATPDTLLFVRGSSLMRQTFDAERLELKGEASPVIQGIDTFGEADERVAGLAFHGAFSTSNNGVLVYRVRPEINRRLVWVDRRGSTTPLNLPPRMYIDPALSPDGRFVALAVMDGSEQHIWVYDIERGTLGRRTFEGQLNAFPIWSRDGKYVIFSRRAAIMRVIADGSGTAEPLVTDEQRAGIKVATSWSADGRALAFQSERDVFVREADGSLTPILATAAFEREGRFSPDGRWMAFRSNETGGDEVYVQSYPSGAGRVLISSGGGAQPMWAPNGRELFYKSGNRMMVVDVKTGSTFEAGAPRRLFDLPFVERSPGNVTPGAVARYSVSPDAERFLIVTTVPDEETSTSVQPFHVVVNWHEELKQRVPTR